MRRYNRSGITGFTDFLEIDSLAKLTGKSGEEQSKAIKAISEESMMATTKQNMIETNAESAALIEILFPIL